MQINEQIILILTFHRSKLHYIATKNKNGIKQGFNSFWKTLLMWNLS